MSEYSDLMESRHIPNEVEKLRSALRASEARVKRLEAELLRWAPHDHRRTCSLMVDRECGVCDCGYESTAAVLEASDE